jgi:hypothetical protein
MEMTKAQLSRLDDLLGQHVSVALADGSRLDDCELVSLPRRSLRTMWLFVNGVDLFVPADDIRDVWEAA